MESENIINQNDEISLEDKAGSDVQPQSTLTSNDQNEENDKEIVNLFKASNFI